MEIGEPPLVSHAKWSCAPNGLCTSCSLVHVRLIVGGEVAQPHGLRTLLRHDRAITIPCQMPMYISMTFGYELGERREMLHAP